LKRTQALSSLWTSRTRKWSPTPMIGTPLPAFFVSHLQAAPLLNKRWRATLAQRNAPLKRNRKWKPNRFSTRKVRVLSKLSHGRPRRLLCLRSNCTLIFDLRSLVEDLIFRVVCTNQRLDMLLTAHSCASPKQMCPTCAQPYAIPTRAPARRQTRKPRITGLRISMFFLKFTVIFSQDRSPLAVSRHSLKYFISRLLLVKIRPLVSYGQGGSMFSILF
jgi:hypothetical protein